MDFTFNVGLGRGHELHERVRLNDPANSVLIIVAIAETGLEDDDVLKDLDTLAAVLAGTTNEVTNAGYARKTLTNADLSAPTIDDSEDAVTLDFPNQTWTPSAGDSWRKMLVCYAPDSTSLSDATTIPLTAHDLLDDDLEAIVPNGLLLTWALPTGFLVCT